MSHDEEQAETNRATLNKQPVYKTKTITSLDGLTKENQQKNPDLVKKETKKSGPEWEDLDEEFDFFDQITYTEAVQRIQSTKDSEAKDIFELRMNKLLRTKIELMQEQTLENDQILFKHELEEIESLL